MITALLRTTRTVRRFQEQRRLGQEELLPLIELARWGGSARNSQPLRFQLVTDPSLCAEIFPLLGWAGYLKDWKGPEPGERPPAYVICLLDTNRAGGAATEAWVDLGIATQNILLGAAEKGVFGCRIGAFSSTLHSLLALEKKYTVLLVLALGYPAEQVILEEVGADGDIRYWRDAEGIHHVPKRSLEDILLPSVK